MKNGYQVVDLLKENDRKEGKEIRKLADSGNKLAKNVMQAYENWYNCQGDNNAECSFVLAYVNYKNSLK
jgi:hypothetical protein